MKKALSIIFIIASGIFVISCRHCNPPIIDNGTISNEAKALIPYQNDDVLTLKHNSGHEVHFACMRQSRIETTSCNCMDCCKTPRIKFEINTIKLEPDYPIFSINFWISNIDQNFISYNCSIGKASYRLPFSNQTYEPMIDSIIINGNTYYNVYGLKADYSNYFNPPDAIRVDSLYINKNEGILKITMTNEEYYEI